MKKLFKLKNLAFFSALIPCTGFAPSLAANSTLKVFGVPYQMVDQQTLPSELGNHPIFGTLSCPPLTRLNLLTQQGEHPLLDELVTHDAAKASVWSLRLKPDLRWWDGSPVTVHDMDVFLREHLPQLVARYGYEKWHLPPFQIEHIDSRTAVVKWEEKPVFGPYLLNGIGFAKSGKDQGAFQCTGPYQISQSQDSTVTLTASTAMKAARFQNIELSRDTPSMPALSGDDAWLHFRHAATYSGTPQGRSSNQSIQCGRPLDLPIITAIAWNPKSPVVSDPEIRKILTKLTPRGALLRSGAGRLGDLVSGPILRAHPGYNRQVLVRPFDLADGSKDLEKHGFVRPRANESRRNTNQKTLKIRLRSPQVSQGMVEKTIGDAFASVGIETEFLRHETDKNKVDGFVSGIALPWPDTNFVADLHSGAVDSPLYPLGDDRLDGLLDQYARSLTTKTPNYQYLRQIHQRLFELEPFTILMQHRTCVEAGKGLTAQLPPVIMRDPHWFYGLVM